ncbi:MAG: TM2 domain-containing protein [Spirochaetaceae bacterium]|jgi:TM2 domain-containing membrane protein YozV|nr:TM2 domain-containing protein [Spirochaetaceae bacterium]
MYSIGLAYLLWFLSGFGWAGLHRFYLGKIPSGLLWLCTGGLFGIGSIYDFFTLGRQVREANYHFALTGRSRRPGFGGETGSWRNVKDGEIRIVRENTKKESPERAILRIAKNNRGIITPGSLALEADIAIEEAKKQLETLVSKGFAELRVRKTGTIVYVIPEFTDADSPLEDF